MSRIVWVTDAVESRRALEESEALYTRPVEEINSIIIEVSPDGAISFFNRFAEKVFGYLRNELIGKKLVGTILPETDSEGRDNSGLVAGMFQNPDQHYLNENIGIRKDGQEIWFSWSARLIREPLAENDAILIELIRVEPEYEKTDGMCGTCIFFHDITARKRAEQELGRLNQVLEQRVDERTRLAEGKTWQLQELTKELIEAEERERKRIADLFHDDLQQLLASAWMQVQATRERHPSIESLKNVESTLKESIEKSRKLLHELTPPVLQQGNLADNIEWLARRMKKQFGLQVRVERTAPPALKTLL